MSDIALGCVESKALEDGRGGLFLNGELLDTFPSEAESDAAGIMLVRMLIVSGMGVQAGQAYKDEKPFDLFGEFNQ
jgi:hypothetical protein